MGRFEAFIGVNFWTALFVLMNTLTIFFVARKYLFDPVMEIIRQRQQEIDGLYDAADSAKTQAESLSKAYREKLSLAQADSDRLVQEAVARGQRREEEIVTNARREATAILDKAASEIAREKEKAIRGAREEISGLALAMAGKVVGGALTAGDQTALVDRFIRELGDGE